MEQGLLSVVASSPLFCQRSNPLKPVRKRSKTARIFFTVAFLDNAVKVAQKKRQGKRKENEPAEIVYGLERKCPTCNRETMAAKTGPAKFFGFCFHVQPFHYFYAQSKIMVAPRLLLFPFLLLCSWKISQAQVSLFAGPQLTTAKYHIRNGKQDSEFKQGFMAGIRLTTLVEGPLYFSPSLYYSKKGYKVTFNRGAYPPGPDAQNNNTSIHTIALAPLLQFNLSKEKTHLFVRFGPGIDINLSGSESFDSTGNKHIDRSMLFGSTGYSPATAFANLHVGFQHRNGLSVFAHYEHGLSNLNNADLGPMILQRVVGVSLGWRLGRK